MQNISYKEELNNIKNVLEQRHKNLLMIEMSKLQQELGAMERKLQNAALDIEKLENERVQILE